MIFYKMHFQSNVIASLYIAARTLAFVKFVVVSHASVLERACLTYERSMLTVTTSDVVSALSCHRVMTHESSCLMFNLLLYREPHRFYATDGLHLSLFSCQPLIAEVIKCAPRRYLAVW